MLLLIGVWIFFMRQMQVGGGKAMSFGKSRAKLLTENQHKVTFNDVAGIDEAKEELEEIIAFLKDPKKFTKLGGRIPKGVLLVGPPGTGKTLLARAIAGEAGVPFFSISGSDFVEMFVGVGASRVRDLFVQGKKNAPCIIFIDEIDAVGRHRGAGLGGGHDEREQTLNQLLVEMDGFETNEGVILIAATNRPDVLDPALLRPGRFDRRVVVPRPGREGPRGHPQGAHAPRAARRRRRHRAAGARHARASPAPTSRTSSTRRRCSPRARTRSASTMIDFEIAKDKVMMGSERRSMIISLEERRNTAYHEAGHALVAKLLPGADPVHKVTIIPRGMALGLTQQVPIDDRHTLRPRSSSMNNLDDPLRRPRRRGAGARPHDHRRRQRHREGDRAGAQDGLRVGHEREARPDDLRQEGGADLPRPRLHPDAGLLGEHRRRDRQRGAAHHPRGATSAPRGCSSDNIEVLHTMAEALLEREVLDGAEIDEIVRSCGGGNGLGRGCRQRLSPSARALGWLRARRRS